MTTFIERHPVASTIGNAAFTGGICALAGFIISKINKTSPLLALILGVEGAVSALFNNIVDIAAAKGTFDQYQATLIKAAVFAVTSVAGVAATVALGIFGTPQIIASAVIGGLYVAFQLACAAYEYNQQYGEAAAV